MSAQEILAWFDKQADAVRAHAGAAFMEVEILRMLVNGSAPVTDDVTSRAYRMEFERRVPDMGERAQARQAAHIAMFASAFGRINLDTPPDYGAAIEQAMLTHAGDTDTLGELLIAALVAGCESSPIAQMATAFDLALQSEPLKFENYHVWVVAGILYALKG